MDKWIKMWSTYTVEYYSFINRMKQSFTVTLMELPRDYHAK